MNYLNFMENRSIRKSLVLRWLRQMLSFSFSGYAARLSMKVSANIGTTPERPAKTIAKAMVGVFNPLPPKGFVVRRAGKGGVESGVERILGRVVAKTEMRIASNLSKDERLKLMRALALSKARDRTLIEMTSGKVAPGTFRGITTITLSGHGNQRPK